MRPTPVRIGILGGLGPLASATFQLRFAQAWARQLPADEPVLDEHYPSILHISEALPGVGAGGVEDTEGAAQELVDRVQVLRQLGAELVVAPCNSLDQLVQAQPELRTGVLTPWNAAPVIVNPRATGVLCSSSLQAHLSRTMPELVFPSKGQQQAVQALIAQGMAAHAPAAAVLHALIADLQDQGATEVRIACTELSCSQLTLPPGVIDNLDALVHATVREARRLTLSRSCG